MLRAPTCIRVFFLSPDGREAPQFLPIVTVKRGPISNGIIAAMSEIWHRCLCSGSAVPVLSAAYRAQTPSSHQAGFCFFGRLERTGLRIICPPCRALRKEHAANLANNQPPLRLITVPRRLRTCCLFRLRRKLPATDLQRISIKPLPSVLQPPRQGRC